MRNLSFALITMLAVLLGACGSGGDASPPEDTGTIRGSGAAESIYGSAANGSIPIQMDTEMLVGLSEPTGYTWMADSGIPWNARYMYLSPGWADNWGWGEYNGDYAFNYMKEAENMNALPVFEFYLLNNIGTGTTKDLYNKTTDPATMKSYFDQSKRRIQG